MKRIIKNIVSNIIDKINLYLIRKNEINKFNNPQRKEIYNKIILNDEQIKEIDELYKNNYGHRIPYTWHKHYTAFTNNFDKNYFPELLYIPEFERFMNINKEYCKAFSDKNVTPLIANSINVKTPKQIIACVSRII